MLEGFAEGAAGAALAFGLLYVLKTQALDRLGSNRNLLQSFYVTTHDALVVGFAVVFVGALVGAVGSAIGLRRFLEV